MLGRRRQSSATPNCTVKSICEGVSAGKMTGPYHRSSSDIKNIVEASVGKNVRTDKWRYNRCNGPVSHSSPSHRSLLCLGDLQKSRPSVEAIPTPVPRTDAAKT